MSRLQLIREDYQRVFRLPEDDRFVPDFAVCCLAAFILNPESDPPWGIITGPPGCGKTEAVRPLLSGLSGKYGLVQKLDGATDKSFISGFRATSDGEDPSFLHLINDKVIIWPELTTLITDNPQNAAAVMGILRSCFDGDGLAKAFGTGFNQIESRFGLLACATGVVDDFLLQHVTLGDRFIQLRMQRTPLSLRAQQRRASHIDERLRQKAEWRASLSRTVGSQLMKLRKDRAGAFSWASRTDEQWESITSACVISARARALPTPGARVFSLKDCNNPGRLQQQVATIIAARAHLDNRQKWNDDDVALGVRICVDSIPPEGLRVLSRLAKSPKSNSVSRATLSSDTNIESDRVSQICRQLRHAGLIDSTPKGFSQSEDLRHLWQVANINESLPPRMRPQNAKTPR